MVPTVKELGADAAQRYAKYPLCDHCMGRTFSQRADVSDYTRLGRKLRKIGRYALPKKCHVCKSIFEHLESHCDEMVRLTSDIEFSTFLVGATLKPSILDADDNVRAKYTLRGTPSAKSDITATLSKMFSRKTKTRASIKQPDITLKVDLRNSSVSVESRPIFIQARYTKELRNLAQKADRCTVCTGKGCMRCAHRGIKGTDSVEGRISEILCDITGSKQARFLWYGSEEVQSIVSGSGRPFIAKLMSPSKRHVRLFKKRDLKEGLHIHGLRYVNTIPKTIPKFSFTAKIQIRTNDDIDPKTLRELRSIANSVTDYGTKTHSRKIYSSSYKKTGSNEFWVKLRVDSGFPLRRFVESSNVSPNITDLLEVQCKYVVADFADVDLVRETPRRAAKS